MDLHNDAVRYRIPADLFADAGAGRAVHRRHPRAVDGPDHEAEDLRLSGYVRDPRRGSGALQDVAAGPPHAQQSLPQRDDRGDGDLLADRRDHPAAHAQRPARLDDDDRGKTHRRELQAAQLQPPREPAGRRDGLPGRSHPHRDAEPRHGALRPRRSAEHGRQDADDPSHQESRRSGTSAPSACTSTRARSTPASSSTSKADDVSAAI